MACDFLNYITRDSVMILEGADKLHIMDELIDRAAELTKLNRDNIYRLTWKREKMMTTAVGKGLALPHIRVNGFPSPLIIVGICKNPVTDYKSLDNQPINLVVFLAADERDQEAYLKLLGSISSKVKEEGVITEILAAGEDKAKIQEILSR